MFDYMKVKLAGNNVVKLKKSIFKDKAIIGSGNEGKVYRISNNECVKIWRESYVDINSPKARKVLKFSNINIKCAILPRKLVFIKNDVRGYIMDYIDGFYPEKNLDFEYSYFIEKIYDLITTCYKELGENNLIIKDVHYGNIMLD